VELQVLAFLDQQRDGAPPVVAAMRAAEVAR
jgi:hypothetical protein